MPFDPVKIPQNVYIEDRIVGPITLRQIILVAIGGGISYAIYASLTKAYGAIGLVPTIVTAIPLLLSVAFAFVRVNDLSMFRLILLMIERMEKPMVRTYAPRGGLTIHIRTTPEPKTEKAVSNLTSPHTRLQELSSLLDSVTPPVAQIAPAEESVRVTDAKQGHVSVTADPLDPFLSIDPLDSPAQSPSSPTAGSSIFRDLFPA